LNPQGGQVAPLQSSSNFHRTSDACRGSSYPPLPSTEYAFGMHCVTETSSAVGAACGLGSTSLFFTSHLSGSSPGAIAVRPPRCSTLSPVLSWALLQWT
jgi:hypothetical protein